MPGAVRGGGGPRRLFSAVIARLPAKRTLVNAAVIQAGKRQAHMFEFQHCFRAGFTHIFDGVLIADIIGTFYSVIHMPLPIVLMGIAQSHGDAALGGYGMGTGRKHLRNQGAGQAHLGNLQSGAHSRTTRANHHGVKLSNRQVHLHTPHHNGSIK